VRSSGSGQRLSFNLQTHLLRGREFDIEAEGFNKRLQISPGYHLSAPSFHLLVRLMSMSYRLLLAIPRQHVTDLKYSCSMSRPLGFIAK